MFDQRVIRVRTKPDTEVVARSTVKPAAGEEVLTQSRLRGGKLINEELLRRRIRLEDSCPLADIASRTAIFRRQLETDLSGKFFNRFGERQVVDFFEKRKDVALFTAPEAVEIGRVGANVEGGRLFIVERAQPLL